MIKREQEFFDYMNKNINIDTIFSSSQLVIPILNKLLNVRDKLNKAGYDVLYKQVEDVYSFYISFDEFDKCKKRDLVNLFERYSYGILDFKHISPIELTIKDNSVCYFTKIDTGLDLKFLMNIRNALNKENKDITLNELNKYYFFYIRNVK